MRQKKDQEIPQDIKEVQALIECWRHTKPRPRAMPEHLWQDAVSLARKYGVYEISRALNVGYAKLKDLTSQTQPYPHDRELVVHDPALPPALPAGFVSFSPASLFDISESSPNELELISVDGNSLIIRTHQPLDLPDLIRSFWGQG